MTNGGDVDPGYLLGSQYRTSGNLSSRLDLHRRFSTNPHGWHRWVFGQLALPGDARILELGCGPGTLWRDNQDRIPLDWRIALSDFSPGMIDAARQRLRGVAPGFSFAVTDARAIPHADGSFDAVIANHMLYHVPDLPLALHEIRRVLRPGGRLYAATNGERHMWELDELVRAHAPDMDMENVAARFGHEHGAAQLEPWFEKVERHDYIDSLEIAEPSPVVDYVRSMPGKESLTDAQCDRMRRAVTEEIERGGVFRVTKSAGLFTCLTGK